MTSSTARQMTAVMAVIVGVSNIIKGETSLGILWIVAALLIVEDR